MQYFGDSFTIGISLIHRQFITVCYSANILFFVARFLHLHTKERKMFMSASREKRARQSQLDQQTQNAKKKKKKRDESSSILTRVLAIVVSALVVVFVAIFFFNLSGMPQRTLPAVRVGPLFATAAEYDVYYNMARYQMAQTNELYKQYGMEVTEPDSEEGKQQLAQQVPLTIQNTLIMADEARKNNVVLNEENKGILEENVQSVKDSAKSQKKSVGEIMEANYGIGVNLATYRKFLEDSMLASQWETEKRDSFTYTQAEYDAYYNEHKDDIDTVNYRAYSFSPEASDENATEEEKKTKLDAAKVKADALLATITDEASFNTLVAAAVPEDQAAAYQDPDATLRKESALSGLSEAQKTWLAAADRKAGDKTLVDNGNGYDVLYFISRQRDVYHKANVRHILVKFKDDKGEATQTPTDAQKETAKKAAQDILDQWKKGEATEASFEALAKEKTEDDGSKDSGGLYESIGKNEMVKPFEEWCLDTARKTGDIELVETEYGYHVIYFISNKDTEAWVDTVRSKLVEEAFTAYSDGLKAANPVTNDELGMSFALKMKKLED